MKENLSTPPCSNLTRRSFFKRSVVTAIAVSSITLFSGLVEAYDSSSYGDPDDVCTDAEMMAGSINTTESYQEDSSGKTLKCITSYNCDNPYRTCSKVEDCEEWHSSYPNVCKLILIEA